MRSCASQHPNRIDDDDGSEEDDDGSEGDDDESEGDDDE